ncbi:uncharacterized protein ARMOST_19052 [Armillaria ostoyae]|uniref:Uncharacterized protein n=1 Tax=Armillaria ostoyae TaxID=47428 RepID=A0A284S3G1_ARMOS|nr:uncharacterized protein ARMOST_19052 [Armillaria ostoyae]
MSPAIPVIPMRSFRAVMFRTAKEVTRIFREVECTFAILRSMACYLYGNDHLPNDVDILMSSHMCKPEWLKEFLVTKNPDCFYLVDAKTPGAMWKVLWYKDYVEGKLEKTKVGILKPVMCSVTASGKRLVGRNDLQPTLNLSQLYTITN